MEEVWGESRAFLLSALSQGQTCGGSSFHRWPQTLGPSDQTCSLPPSRGLPPHVYPIPCKQKDGESFHYPQLQLLPSGPRVLRSPSPDSHPWVRSERALCKTARALVSADRGNGLLRQGCGSKALPRPQCPWQLTWKAGRALPPLLLESESLCQHALLMSQLALPDPPGGGPRPCHTRTFSLLPCPLSEAGDVWQPEIPGTPF